MSQQSINEIEVSLLGAVVGGNWVSKVSDAIGPRFTKDWNKLDCVTRASYVSEVGEFNGSTAGFVGGLALTQRLAHKPLVATVGGFVSSKAAKKGVARQYAMGSYLEACKAGGGQ